MKILFIFSILFNSWHVLSGTFAHLPGDKSNPYPKYSDYADSVFYYESKQGDYITNLSGVTYIPEKNLYLAIRNNDRYLHIIDHNFKLIKDIKIRGFNNYYRQKDIEGIAHIETSGDYLTIALVNEIGELYIGNMNQKQNYIHSRNFKKIKFYNHYIPKNLGPEGLSYDKDRKIFYIGFEGSGGEYTKIIALTIHNNQVKTWLPFDITKKIEIGDIAGIHYMNDHLYILSEVDSKIYEFDINGNFKSYHQLSKDRQQEGISIDENSNLIIVGEDNFLELFLHSKNKLAK